jgi:hypothetical protein
MTVNTPFAYDWLIVVLQSAAACRGKNRRRAAATMIAVEPTDAFRGDLQAALDISKLLHDGMAGESELDFELQIK